MGSIPELGRSARGEHSSPLQGSCLENPMNSAAWQATVHGVAKSRTQLKCGRLTWEAPSSPLVLGLSIPPWTV